jgi:hypothetical protein
MSLTSAQFIDRMLAGLRRRESQLCQRIASSRGRSAYRELLKRDLDEVRAEYSALSAAMDAFELLRTAKKAMMEQDNLFTMNDEIFAFLEKHTGDGTHEVSP